MQLRGKDDGHLAAGVVALMQPKLAHEPFGHGSDIGICNAQRFEAFGDGDGSDLAILRADVEGLAEGIHRQVAIARLEMWLSEPVGIGNLLRNRFGQSRCGPDERAEHGGDESFEHDRNLVKEGCRGGKAKHKRHRLIRKVYGFGGRNQPGGCGWGGMCATSISMLEKNDFYAMVTEIERVIGLLGRSL